MNEFNVRPRFSVSSRKALVLCAFEHMRAVCAASAPDSEFSVETETDTDRLRTVVLRGECRISGGESLDRFTDAKAYASESANWLFGENVDVGICSGRSEEDGRAYFEIEASFV